MEPFTARALKVRKNNSLKDFVAVAGPLGVTHFLVFSKSSSSINFYSLIKDVVSSLKRHRMHEQQFTHHPLLVLSNFGLQQIQVKVMASMFQNMFPSINVHRVNLNNIKRCLLIAYNAETQQLDFRHYSVKVVPVGVSKGLKKLLQEKFPNMSRLEDISELLVKDINLSESEAEQDGTHNTLELPQAYAGRGNMKAQQSAVRLTEIGPRMTLQLVKVEEGLAQGNVLYHSFVHKTESEVREMLDGDSDAEDPGAPEQPEAAEHSESDNDAEYYREEVGEEPDKDLFPKRKRSSSGAAPLRKRRRRSRPEDPDLYLHPKSPAGTWDPCLHPKSSVCTPRSLPAPPDLYLHPRSPAGTWDPCLHPKIPACTPGVLSLPAPQESCVHPKIPACAPTVLPAPPDLYLHPKIPACTWDLYLHPEIQGSVYSFHLALSGLLYSLSLLFLAAYYYPPKDWRYGAALCKLERFLFNCNLYGGTFFLACISLNRFLAIVHPLRTRGRLHRRGAHALTFLLTAACYAAVLRTVWRNRHLGPVEKRKVGLLVGAGMALYAFSYLPYHVFRNLNLRRRLLAPGAENCGVSRAVHAACGDRDSPSVGPGPGRGLFPGQ
nr:suppressor of SWI4 1 homolog [Columba livia]